MRKIFFYTRSGCLLCDEAQAMIAIFEALYDIQIEIRDIETNDAWLERYQLEIPVLTNEEKTLTGKDMTYDKIEVFFKQMK